jgi:hypothetical protein
LALDRESFVDIITDGQGKIGGVMLAGPEGSWGMKHCEAVPLKTFEKGSEGARQVGRSKVNVPPNVMRCAATPHRAWGTTMTGLVFPGPQVSPTTVS